MFHRWMVAAGLVALTLCSADSGAQTKRQTIANQLADIQRAGGDHLGYAPAALDALSRAFNIVPEGYRLPRRHVARQGRHRE